MSWTRVMAARLSGLFGERRLERELDDEIRSHLEMQIEDNLAAGMDPAEARYAALRSFGDVEPMKEAYRERRTFALVETLVPAEAIAVSGQGTGRGEAMRTRGFGRLARWAAYVVTVVLGLVLAGDRGRAAVVPAVIYGQDPLEVLELKVRPNVIVVLDSSGSMKWGTTAPSGPASNFWPPQAGDHPRSKTFQAKQVLKQIVTNNQDKVSFMFGKYTQDAVIVMGNRNAATSSSANLTGSSANRFTSVADSTTSPSMVTTQLSIQNDLGGSGGRGIQSWQLIYPAWNTLH